MDHPYHITVFDNFHRYEPGWAWVSGSFATAEAAVAAVKSDIDHELAYFWSEICHQDKGLSTLDRLISQYNSFAEMPVAFSDDGTMIFDSTAYVNAKAAEIVNQAPAPYGLRASTASGHPAEERPGASPPPSPELKAVVKRRFPRLIFSKPQTPIVFWATFLVFCLVCRLIYSMVR